MKILVVEDEQGLREALMESLRASDYLVDGTGDGESGLDMIRGNSYDLIILDIMLPGLNGMDLLTIIRKLNITVPVILLTALSQLEYKVQGMDCGADDFEPEEDCFTIYTSADDFNEVADALMKKGYAFASAQIEMVPQNYVKLSEADASNMEKMLDLFEDDDDVQNVWHNWDRE